MFFKGECAVHATVKDHISDLLSEHLGRLVSTCLAFLCEAHTNVAVHIKDPMPSF